MSFFFCALASRALGQTVSSTVSFVDANGQPTETYLEETRAYLRVVDSGADVNAASADTVTVELTTAVWSDLEDVALQETGPGTGVFEGSIELMSAGPVVPNNGVLETGVASGPPVHYDTLTASYTDSAAAVQAASAMTLGYRTWFLDSLGAVVDSYLQGARVYVRLEDHNNNNPTSINFLYVDVGSSLGDQEIFRVYETGLATGIYEGSIPLDGGAAAPGDDRLQAQGGDEITVDRLGPWFPAPAHAVIDSASIEFVDGAGLATSEVVVNGTARLRVASPQANVNSGAAETLIAQLSTLHLGDQETVLLSETGPNTGLFEGSIRLRFGFAANPQDGMLDTGTNRQALPEEITAVYGSYSATAHTIWSRVSFLNRRDQEVTSYSLRSLIRVQVENQINNDPAQIDTLEVALTSPGTGDAETVAVTETGADTGLFLGALPNLETGGWSGDGILSVGAGQAAVARVPDPFGSTIEAQALFIANFVPVAGNDVLYTEENSEVSSNVRSNDYDTEGSFSLVAVTQGANGSVVFDAYGNVTYTPNPGSFGQDTFTYLLVDEQGGEGLGTVTVIVNAPPVAADDVASVDEDGSVAVPVLANDNDPENGTLQLTITTPPAHGTAEVNLDQTVAYTPVANYYGTDTFTYRIADENGWTAFATVTVAVNPVNDPPVARADTSIIFEDSPGIVRVLDTDVEGDALTVTSVTPPAVGGTVTIDQNQTVGYTPPLNFFGQVSLVYAISDGNGGTATATVTITVNPQNDPPVANADTATVAEDGTVNVVVLANDTDVENNVLTLVSVTQGAHGAVLMNFNKTVKYTPAANYNGPDSFTYTISDGNGGTATAVVSMTITAVNGDLHTPSDLHRAGLLRLRDLGRQRRARERTRSCHCQRPADR
ncbi:MAG TPA: Ig-like domain-containing protein [Thermoanaerobaculia bacterium]|jgi:hypothetical protein|nr:Ig-like domain-containing protein [Thermoanaerobaculia bacterium]